MPTRCRSQQQARPPQWRRAAFALLALAPVAAHAAADDAPPTAPATPARWQLEAGITHDDNLTRGREPSEKRSDQAYAVRLSRDAAFTLSPSMRLTLGGSAGAETLAQHNKLGRVFGEGQLGLEYRASGEFSAPTFGVFARASAHEYRSVLRSGYRYAAGASASAALTDRINAFGSLAYEGAHARSAVFGGHAGVARLNLDYALSDAGTLYFNAEYRRGDSTASGGASLENIDIAKLFVTDDAFAAEGFRSYRFEARTWVGALGYNHGFGPHASVDLSWRHARATPTATLAFASRVPNRYVANQFALSVLWRF